jgi:hypothetical protein
MIFITDLLLASINFDGLPPSWRSGQGFRHQTVCDCAARLVQVPLTRLWPGRYTVALDESVPSGETYKAIAA